MPASEWTRQLRARHNLAPVGIAVAVAAGYYIGSLIGLQLRLPPATPSVVWPPNATLTAALLLTRPRRWWIVLAAALPAHLAVQLQTDWPLPLIGALFLTNCLEALVAALGFRLLSDGVPRLDRFARLLAFFAAAGVAAPLLSSFADAAVVHGFRGEPYWQIWRFRLFSNTLAELTVAPGIIGAVFGLRHWAQHRSGWRAVEAAMIGIGLMGTALVDFAGQLPPTPTIRAVFTQTPEAVQMPFLLWAVVRFGPAGTGVALLLSTLLNAWDVVHAVRPLSTVAPVTSVTAMSLSLIVAAVTLLCLTTLIEERRHSQAMLTARLRFEELLSGLSRAFVQLPSNRMDRALDSWLARIGSFLKVECLGLVVVSDGAWDHAGAHVWRSQGLSGASYPAAFLDRPGTIEELTSGRQVTVEDPADLPTATAGDPGSLDDADGAAAVTIHPLVGAEGLLGALVCGRPDDGVSRSEVTSSLRLVGSVLAAILERKAAEDSLRKSEVMNSSILQSLTTGVVVVDSRSHVLAQNLTWLHLARRAGCVDTTIGSSFLDTLKVAADAGSALSVRMADALSAVLAGAQPQAALEHGSESGLDPRFWAVQVVPLSGGHEGAVVTLVDITDVRRAELDALRSRQELAHVARLSTVGELTASIAHQLNQPLTAIMTNAQAARRILAWTDPDLDEVRAILTDIVKDDRRASEVIQRVRALLSNGELQMDWIDLSALIREVAQLLSNEAVIRDVALSLSFDSSPVYARGDRVQLQQVVLNLLQNAMEAMTPEQRCGRVIDVHCEEDDGQVRVSVHDSGPGLRSGAEKTVFEPFFSTKTGGMGMGLSIVRSIVDAHGGAIRARNHPRGGAVFEFTLQSAAPRSTA